MRVSRARNYRFLRLNVGSVANKQTRPLSSTSSHQRHREERDSATSYCGGTRNSKLLYTCSVETKIESTRGPWVLYSKRQFRPARDVVDKVVAVERPWISVYCDNAPHASIHAKLSITSNVQERSKADVEVEESFSQLLRVGKVEGKELDLSVATTSQQGGLLANKLYANISLPQIYLRLPQRTKESLATGAAGVTAFDIAQTSEGHYVVGGQDGQAHIGRLLGGQSFNQDASATRSDDVEARAQRRMQQRLEEQKVNRRIALKGHVGDIRSARFFPSGQGEH